MIAAGEDLPAALAGAAADGAARATGRPAVLLAGSGAALNLLLPALVVADADSVPLIVLERGGSAADLESGRDLPGGLPDALRLTEAFVGWNTRVDRPEDLPLVIEAAFGDLARRRPRPLLIEIADEALAPWVEAAGRGQGPDLSPKVIPLQRPGDRSPADPRAGALEEPGEPIDRQWLEQVAAALVRARRPAIVAGGGAVAAGDALLRLAERIAAPVFMTLSGRGLLPGGHPLAFDGLYGLNAPEARRWLRDADVVLVVGTTLSPVEHGDLDLAGRVIHIDRDYERLGRNFPVWMGLAADSRHALDSLDRKVAAELEQPRGPEAYLGATGPEERRRAVNRLREELDPPDVWTAGLDAQLTAADPDALSVTEASALPVAEPRSLLLPLRLGTPGYALAAAWGAAKATGRPVRAIVSPAGFWNGWPVLRAAVRQGVPLEALVRLGIVYTCHAA
ncbi:MAG: thiamine pyrophosphate-binding protein, partial [Bacillota bacterium]